MTLLRDINYIIFRDDGTTLLHGLQPLQAHHSQDGHFKVLRPCHLGCHWAECHHHGHGVLHDAGRKSRSI